ncbi:MAG TPA: CBS domain-containing protein [Actinomycetota bacterium]
MKVRAVYRPEVLVADSDESLIDVAGRMQFEEVGSLAIIEHGRLVGIITERDLARALSDGVDPVETPVADYMTAEPVTVSPDTEVSAAAAAMLELGVRHLPVMEEGRVVGMVSSRDLLSIEAWSATGVM